jgi:hypothetical protein
MFDDRKGYVRVLSLERNDDISTDFWMQIGQDIVGEAVGDQLGWCVSLSDDARTLAVGAPYTNTKGDDSGTVRISRMGDPEAGWIQLGIGIDGESAYNYLGMAVSLSADGNTLAIGSSQGSEYNGDMSGNVLCDGL